MDLDACGRPSDANSRYGYRLSIGTVGIDMNHLSANLLPKHVLEQQQVRHLLRVWIRMTFICGLLAGGAMYLSMLANEQAVHTLATSQESAREARRVMHEIAGHRRDVQQLQKLKNDHARLRSVHPPLAVLTLLEQVRESTEHQAQVQMLDFHDRPLEATNGSRAKAGPSSTNTGSPNPAPSNRVDENAGTLRLRFIVPSADLATSVINTLRQSTFFRDVTLDSPIEQDQAGKQMSFSVRCQF